LRPDLVSAIRRRFATDGLDAAPHPALTFGGTPRKPSAPGPRMRFEASPEWEAAVAILDEARAGRCSILKSEEEVALSGRELARLKPEHFRLGSGLVYLWGKPVLVEVEFDQRADAPGQPAGGPVLSGDPAPEPGGGNPAVVQQGPDQLAAMVKDAVQKYLESEEVNGRNPNVDRCVDFVKIPGASRDKYIRPIYRDMVNQRRGRPRENR
jgi:hypothetical protein